MKMMKSLLGFVVMVVTPATVMAYAVEQYGPVETMAAFYGVVFVLLQVPSGVGWRDRLTSAGFVVAAASITAAAVAVVGTDAVVVVAPTTTTLLLAMVMAAGAGAQRASKKVREFTQDDVAMVAEAAAHGGGLRAAWHVCRSSPTLGPLHVPIAWCGMKAAARSSS